MSTSSTTWAPGTVVPGTVYRVIRPLGQGGMGEVYEVEHDLLGTRRALKVLARQYADREDLAERLRVEARGLARLKHPNLVEVYDLGTAADGRIFFAMELLKGATLRELLRSQGKLSPAAAVRVIAQVLDGLDAAHAAGMLHRDVKPENVFVCRDGIAKLLDFGVAKAIDASTPVQAITGVGMTVGTPRYMSPEQAEGRVVDARTDIYSVGLVLWEVLLGRPAFEDTSPIAIATSKLTDGVPLLETQAGAEGIPRALCEVVNRACMTEPSRRFSTAEAFASALRQAVPAGGGEVAPRRSWVPEPLEQASTVVAPVGGFAQVTEPPGQATEVDPSSSVGAGETLPATPADEALRELTERIAVAQTVDRDQPTSVAPAPMMRGPTGTQMLPAVAARHRAASIPAPAQARPGGAATREAATMVSTQARRAAGRRRAGVNWTSVAAGIVAFTLPVCVAAIVGYARFDLFRKPSDTSQPPAVSGVVSAAAVVPGAALPAEPEVGSALPMPVGSPSPAEVLPSPPSASLSETAPKKASSPPARTVSPPVGGTRTSRPPPARTAPVGSTERRLPTMPASGL